MVFLNWLLLGGMAAIAAPILIHLIHRSRVQLYDWAAMQFLEEALVGSARRIKLQDLLLLALRVALIANIVLALMRPSLRAPIEGLRPLETSTSAVILLDDSISMNTGRRQTPWLAAQKMAQQYIASLGKGDDVTVMFRSSATREQPVAQFDLQRAAERVEHAQISALSVPLPNAIAAALQHLQNRHNPNRELLVLTDGQVGAWQFENGPRWRFLAQSIATMSVKPNILVACTGRIAQDNLAVIGLQPQRLIVERGSPMQFDVVVKNYGASTADDVVVLFSVNGVLKAQRNTRLPPNAQETVSFGHTFDAPGNYYVQTAVSSAYDALPDDNKRYYSVTVIESLPVLLVDGRSGTHATERETYFLKTALSPADPERPEWRSTIDATSCSLTELRFSDFSKYRVIVLANVAAIPGTLISQLERFIVAGGGLLIACGERMQLEHYNRELYRDGAGLLPLPLQPMPEAQTAGPLRLATISNRRGPFDLFRSATGPDWSRASFRRFLLADTARIAPDTEVLARFSNGKPAFVQKRLGEGKVMLFTSTLDTAWTDLPVHPFFVPLVQHLIYDLATNIVPPQNLTAGQPFSHLAGVAAGRQKHLLLGPDRHPLVLDAVAQGNATLFTTAQQLSPGLYTVHPENDATSPHYYAVTLAPEESDLLRIDERHRELLERDLHAHFVEDWDTLKQYIGLQGGRIELTQFFLAFAVALCFLEIFLTRIWS